ncbi:hypothetical protein IGB42_04309 [Andreprevotia sp. IGB-42]|nr:hypothetical protein IGB42_04309 [Andreprevotia sp. IGB-42]
MFCADPTLSRSPSTSVSLPSRSANLMVTGVPSLVVKWSATATGASLTGVTPTLTVMVSLPPLPSLTVTVKLSAPL